LGFVEIRLNEETKFIESGSVHPESLAKLVLL
jgi:hypothetical protein